MKKVLVATALAVFGFAPAMSAACDYNDESSASATPPVLASAPTPAATKAPAPALAKTLGPNAVKQVAGKVKAPVPDQKIAVGTTN